MVTFKGIIMSVNKFLRLYPMLIRMKWVMPVV